MLIACRLAKSGYYEGDPDRVLQAPANMVQAILDYEDFLKAYEKVYVILNKK